MGGRFNRMAALDSWTDGHVEEAIRLLVQSEMLCRILVRYDTDAATARAASNFLTDVGVFLKERA